MLELFSFLEGNKQTLVEDLTERIPDAVPVFLKVPRSELQESLDQWFDAFGDYIVTGEPDTLTTVLRYTTKVRAQQSFKLSDLVRAYLLVLPTVRMQLDEAEEFQDQEDKAEALEKLEDAHANAVCLFVDIYQEYLINMLNEHRDYLKKTNQKYGIDMSKFITFKG